MGRQRADDPPTVVDAFRAGDEAALAAVYDRWSPLVYSLALRTLSDVDAAEQVTQRVFTGAWAARHTVGPREPLPGWLVGITRNEIAAVLASRTAPIRDQRPLTRGARAEDLTEQPDLAERLVVADEMSRLDGVPQQVLNLALRDELTHTQIAERLGLPLGTVTGHLRRGLLVLRERLGVLSDAC